MDTANLTSCLLHCQHCHLQEVVHTVKTGVPSCGCAFQDQGCTKFRINSEMLVPRAESAVLIWVHRLRMLLVVKEQNSPQLVC